jgi:hypothetical protein
MLTNSHRLATTVAIRRRLPVQSQRETAERRELDVRELSTDAQVAVSTGLIHVLAVLTPRPASSPRQAAKRKTISAPPPYHLLDLPVAPSDEPVVWD